jgi:sugar phosphate isomerase/epimerase
VKLSLSEISTVAAPFSEDVEAYADAGFDGIGLWEFKLPADDGANVERLERAGLGVSNCVPSVPSILPLRIAGLEGPRDPGERIRSLCVSMGRLAQYDPASVLILTGPCGDLEAGEARRIVVEALPRVAEAAEAAGVRLGLEPIHPNEVDEASFIHTLGDAAELLSEAGLDRLGIMLDTFHVADGPEFEAEAERYAGRITGVHVADRRSHEHEERVLPGEGLSRTHEVVARLAALGFDGYLDVEIFSTPDGFWALPAAEAARQAHAAAATLLPGA